MEEEYVVARSQLRTLRQTHPQWTQQQLAGALKRSVPWVKKWLKRLAAASSEDEAVLHSQSRARKTPPERVSESVVQRILDIRDHPPQGLQRTPGPKAIVYYLQQALGSGYPTSTRTIWQILRRYGRIVDAKQTVHEPWPPTEPMQDWQLDFKSVSSVPPDPTGKQQHVVEVLNVVDTGTSILLQALPRADYTAETAILAVTHTLLVHGRPRRLTFDRDPRFVGSNLDPDFPSAFIRFLWCLGIEPQVCPPRRPDLNGFVERYHRSYDEECLQVHRPATLEAVEQVTEAYQHHYNTERPHQGRQCHNQPPYQAFPRLPRLPRLPVEVDPNAWLRAFHHTYYRRRVTHNGRVQVGRHRYYIRQDLAGRWVVLRLNAPERTLTVLVDGKPLKDIPLKGVQHDPMPFEDYLRLICEEAVSEYRLLRKCQWRRVAA